MKLNRMDFWESEKTGLQLTTFPPFAAILKWRGEGKFRESKDLASDTHYGLLLTGTQNKKGSERKANSRISLLSNSGFCYERLQHIKRF